MSKFFKWLEYIWNLRLILDEYIPKIKEIIATLQILQMQLEDLRQAKMDLEKELKRLKEEQQGAVIEVVEDKPAVGYDPQVHVEYVDVSNEDTVRE